MLGLEELLHERAASYDEVADRYHAKRFATKYGRYDLVEGQLLVSDLLGELADKRRGNWLVLDVACGSGKVTVAAAALGSHVVALDASPKMLLQCLDNCQRAHVHDRVRLVGASADRMPFPEGQFDAVFAFRFLHLFPAESYQVLIREMLRVVKPGGWVAVEMKNRWYGGVLYLISDIRRRLTGRTDFSSYVDSRSIRTLERDIGCARLSRRIGLLLPKGHWLVNHPLLARAARHLARGPLMPLSAHFVAVYQRTG